MLLELRVTTFTIGDGVDGKQYILARIGALRSSELFVLNIEI